MSDGSKLQWLITESGANLQCGPLAAHVEFGDAAARLCCDQWLERPARGTAVLVTGGPLEKSAALVPHDVYARGSDLVVTFEKLPPHEVAPQIYWRAACLASDSVQIELVVSMRTDLLDSNPLSMVHSVAAGSRVLHCSDLASGRFTEERAEDGRSYTADESREHLFLLENDALGLVYAEMVHPTDFVSARLFTVGPGASVGIESALFPERLEKGVIRRARVCGWFLPSPGGAERALSLARVFAASEAPLTA